MRKNNSLKYSVYFITFVLLCHIFSSRSWALVDYGGASDSGSDSVGDLNPKQTSISPVESTPQKRGFKFLQFNTNFESRTFEQKNRSGSVQMLGANLVLRSPYSFFAEASYYEGQVEEKNREHPSSESGNPKFLVGSNWLQLGGPQDNARVDVYVGVSQKTNNSTIGSSRTDKLVGIETSKQIYMLMIGLGGQYIMTGNPEDAGELRIGNMLRMTAAVGTVVSSDIRFSIETSYYRLSKAQGIKENEYALNEDLSFSSVGPKLSLGIGKLFELDLGAHFQTKRAKVQDNSNVNLLDAKLFQFPGVYGTSMFAGLNFSV